MFTLNEKDPHKKREKSWILQAVRHYYNQTKYDTDNFYGARDRYDRLRKYANGTQDISHIKKLLEEKGNSETWLKMNWSEPLRIMPKIRRMALSMIRQQKYDLVATPIDGEAQAQKRKQEATMRANIGLQQAGGGQYMDPSLLQQPGEPKSEEELNLLMEYGFKHNEAREMEQWIKAVFNHNDYDTTVRERVRQDVLDIGVGAARDWVDRSGKIRTRRCDPANLLVFNANDRCDFKDAVAIGEVLHLSLEEIKQMHPNLSREELETLEAKTGGAYGQHNPKHNTQRIDVLDICFFSINAKTLKTSRNKYGNMEAHYTAPKKVGQYGPYHYDQAEYLTYYTAKWVIDSDIIFDYGEGKDIVRPDRKLGECRLPFHLYAPEYEGGRITSTMETCIPHLDSLMMAYFKFQHEMLTARPGNAVYLDPDALVDSGLQIKGGRGEDGTATPEDLIDLFFKRNLILARQGDGQGREVFKEFSNKSLENMANWWNVINQELSMLRNIIGFNELSDGGTVNARTLNGVAGQMMQQTHTALEHISFAEQRIAVSVATAIHMRVKDLVRQGRADAYATGLGEDSLKHISEYFTRYEYAIELEPRVTEQDRLWLDEQINVALANGKIDLKTAVIVRNTDNLKLAEMLLGYYQTKYEERMHQQSMQLQQQNGQIQQQSAQVAEQMKQQTIQLESQSDITLEEVKHRHKMEQIQLQKELERINQADKLEVTALDNERDRETQQKISKQRPAATRK